MEPIMEAAYKEAARQLAIHRQCVVLSGAGISAESGLGTFRDAGGLWEFYSCFVFHCVVPNAC